MINYLLQTKKPVRCWECGRPATISDIESYPHDGGWNGKWYYIDCPQCGYQTSFAKLGVDRAASGTLSYRGILNRIHPDHNNGSALATKLTATFLKVRNSVEWFCERYKNDLMSLVS